MLSDTEGPVEVGDIKITLRYGGRFDTASAVPEAELCECVFAMGYLGVPPIHSQLASGIVEVVPAETE